MAAKHSRRATRRKAGVRPPAKRGGVRRKWSGKVTQESDAMDLQSGVFKLKSPRTIANSLKRSSEASRRRKSSPFRSAMSMLNFEINRAGKNMSKERIRILNQAKVELRKAFGRPPGGAL
jgi:Protein of unknown function (DUF3175)